MSINLSSTDEIIKELDIENWSMEQMRIVGDFLMTVLGLDQELDVEKELSMHYAKTKMAYDSLLNAVKDGSAPQGLASMASSLTKILGDVADKKVAVRTAKDYQRLEAAIMVALESIPQEYAKEAVAELRRVLEDDNG